MRSQSSLVCASVVVFVIAGLNLPKASAKPNPCRLALSRLKWPFLSRDAKRFATQLNAESARGFAGHLMDALPGKSSASPCYYLASAAEHNSLRLAASLSVKEQLYFRRQLPARDRVPAEGQIFLDLLELALMDPAAWRRAADEIAEARGSAFTFSSTLPFIKDLIPPEIRREFLRRMQNYRSLKLDGEGYPITSPKRLADHYLKFIHRGDALIKTAQLNGASAKDAYALYWDSVQKIVQVANPMSAEFVFELLRDIRGVLDELPPRRFPPEVILYGSIPNARADVTTSDLDLSTFDVDEVTAIELKEHLRLSLNQAFPGNRIPISINLMQTTFALQNQSVVFRVRPGRIELVVADLSNGEPGGNLLTYPISPAGGVDFTRH